MKINLPSFDYFFIKPDFKTKFKCSFKRMVPTNTEVVLCGLLL